jgi:hypothetical protein
LDPLDQRAARAAVDELTDLRIVLGEFVVGS